MEVLILGVYLEIFFFRITRSKVRVRIIHGRALYTGKYGRSYLAEGGGIQHLQIELKFWHYTTNKFDVRRTDINI